MKFYEFGTEDHDFYAMIAADNEAEAKRIYADQINDADDELKPRLLSLEQASEVLLEADDLEDMHDELLEREKEALKGIAEAKPIVIDTGLL